MQQEQGKVIILVGVVIVGLGLLYYFFGNMFSWMGRLPGDIRVEKPGFRLYIPITTMILLSLFLSLLMYVWRRFF